MTAAARWLRKLICRVTGHRFTVFADYTKRRCDRCGREEWVFSNPFPRTGEPASYWKQVDWEKSLTARARFNQSEG